MPHDTATGAETRLATYGTLAPGRVNHHQLSGLHGAWLEGTVRGHLSEAGWGAAQGFPGLTLDPAGPAVAVHIFVSPGLPAQWTRLDAFEGPGYRRVVTRAETPGGAVAVSIYEVIRPQS
ncbi:MAG: gamma-glutamylcyclotransferase [Pseudomonadota bacterium]